MTDAQKRLFIDSYLDWTKAEGVPIHEDYAIDSFAVSTAPWPRFGMKGAALHLKGRGDFTSMFLFELAPGGSSISISTTATATRATSPPGSAASAIR